LEKGHFPLLKPTSIVSTLHYIAPSALSLPPNLNPGSASVPMSRDGVLKAMALALEAKSLALALALRVVALTPSLPMSYFAALCETNNNKV